MGIAQRLVELMDSFYLTKYKLSKEISVHPTTVTNWLDGMEPRKEHIKKLCEYFDVSSDYLIGNTDIKKPDGEQKEKPLVNKDEGLTEIKKDFIGDIKQLTDEDIQSLRPVVKNLLKNNDK